MRRMIARPLMIAAAFLAAGVASHGPGARAAQIEDIRVHLFYERSGTLSGDLTKKRDLALWNTIIGAGDAEEPADSFLVAAVVRGTPETFENVPVTVTVFDAKTQKVLAKKRFNGLLFGKDGRVIKPLFVADQTCTAVRIVARSGNSMQTASVPFACGE